LAQDVPPGGACHWCSGQSIDDRMSDSLSLFTDATSNVGDMVGKLSSEFVYTLNDGIRIGMHLFRRLHQ
jgi:hypothetical protein